MEIQNRANKLVELRKEINKLQETMNILKGKRDNIQRELVEEMGNLNLKSFKNDKVTVAKATRKTLQIVNEEELIKELENKGIKDEYVSEQINKDLFRGLATQLVKEGKKMRGTEIREIEFLSIRDNQSN